VAKGDALAYGFAAAGAAAAAFVGVYLLTRGTTPPPQCDQGYFGCSSGVCCPNGDSCANTDGSCPSGSTPDPANPGCCLNACPPSCTSDSGCSGCGSGFVCEGGECTKQEPKTWDGPGAVELDYTAGYASTGCFLPVCIQCCKCGLTINLEGTADGGYPTATYTLVDAYGRGVPNQEVSLDISNLPSYIEPYTNGSTTDANGEIQVILVAPGSGWSPWNDIDYSGYTCDACGGQGSSGNFGGELGTMTIYATDNPNLQLQVVLTYNVDWTETVDNAGGCPCCT